MHRDGLIGRFEYDVLNGVGFEWNADVNDDAVFSFQYQRLLRFRMIHGHVNVPQSWREVPKLDPTKGKRIKQQASAHWDSNLGVWVWRLRRLFRTGALPKEQLSLLDGLGFVWNFKEHVWESYFYELMFFKMNQGHCLVSKSFMDSTSLLFWVRNQRKERKMGRLCAERTHKLNKLGFVWDVLSEPLQLNNSIWRIFKRKRRGERKWFD